MYNTTYSMTAEEPSSNVVVVEDVPVEKYVPDGIAEADEDGALVTAADSNCTEVELSSDSLGAAATAVGDSKISSPEGDGMTREVSRTTGGSVELVTVAESVASAGT